MTEILLSTNGALQPVQEAQPQPLQPNYNITPDGMTITIPTGPNTALLHAIPTPVMQQIMRKWREVERVNADMARIAQDALRTKR